MLGTPGAFMPARRRSVNAVGGLLHVVALPVVAFVWLPLLFSAAVAAAARPVLPLPPPGSGVPTLALGDGDAACASAYRLGVKVGARFRGAIRRRLAKSRAMAGLRRCAREGQGARIAEMWRANEQAFPHFAQEVNGTADGAGVAREDIVLLNLRKELTYVCAEFLEGVPRVTHCSDQLVSPRDDRLPRIVGHNEDGACEDAGLLYWVQAPTQCGVARSDGDSALFGAMTYAGELPTAAFGLNSHGVALTFNALSPLHLGAGLLARNLVSRAALNARTVDEALATLSVPGQAVGHNAQVFAWRGGGPLVTLEVGPSPFGTDTLHLSAGMLAFHANAYLRLAVPEGPQPSSVHRERRARALVDSGLFRDFNISAVPDVRASSSRLLADVSLLLMDQRDVAYPIFQTGKHDTCTLASAIFDLREGTVRFRMHRVAPVTRMN